jgi:hypothetical protein
MLDTCIIQVCTLYTCALMDRCSTLLGSGRCSAVVYPHSRCAHRHAAPVLRSLRRLLVQALRAHFTYMPTLHYTSTLHAHFTCPLKDERKSTATYAVMTTWMFVFRGNPCHVCASVCIHLSLVQSESVYVCSSVWPVSRVERAWKRRRSPQPIPQAESLPFLWN